MLQRLFSLKNRVTIVTGGARGIGKVVAEHLAAVGSDIVIMDILERDAEKTAKQISDEYGVKSLAFSCDVTDIHQVECIIEKAGNVMGTLDILFNNAGICIHKSALTVTKEEWQKVIDVNLNGVFYVAKAFANYLVKNKKGGSIINTASMSGSIINTPQEQASYNSSKAAVIHLTKSLAVEWAPHNIRVNSISPGYMRTEMTGSIRQDWQDYWTNMIPFKRMGKPSELAGAVIYFASDASTYTSGCDIIIDGCFSVI